MTSNSEDSGFEGGEYGHQIDVVRAMNMSIPTEVGEDGEISLFEDEKTFAFLAGVLEVEEVNQQFRHSSGEGMARRGGIRIVRSPY